MFVALGGDFSKLHSICVDGFFNVSSHALSMCFRNVCVQLEAVLSGLSLKSRRSSDEACPLELDVAELQRHLEVCENRARQLTESKGS